MTPRDLLILAILALVFTPLEHLRPAQAFRRSASTLRVDLLHILLSGFAIRVGATLTTLGLASAVAAFAPAAWGERVRAQPDILEFLEILILADLGFYVAHRIVHAVPWLWRFHQIHHSSEHLDWIATHRVHPVDQIFNSTVIAIPLVALGFSPAPLLAYALIYRFHSVLLHSNVRIGFGPFERLVTSPRYHHWHHADHVEAHDRNFGGQLVMFDWLFGTLHLPKRAWPDRYGVGEPMPKTYLGQLAHPFGAAKSPGDVKEMA